MLHSLTSRTIDVMQVQDSTVPAPIPDSLATKQRSIEIPLERRLKNFKSNGPAAESALARLQSS